MYGQLPKMYEKTRENYIQNLNKYFKKFYNKFILIFYHILYPQCWDSAQIVKVKLLSRHRGCCCSTDLSSPEESKTSSLSTEDLLVERTFFARYNHTTIVQKTMCQAIISMCPTSRCRRLFQRMFASRHKRLWYFPVDAPGKKPFPKEWPFSKRKAPLS